MSPSLNCRDGVVEVCKEECTQPKDTIDTWSDCLTTKLHLNSFVTLPGYWHNEYVTILYVLFLGEHTVFRNSYTKSELEVLLY